jgi:hypothetical protein
MSANILALCTVLAELLVAWVIYIEVDHSRRLAFLEKATRFEANEDRQRIYEAYLGLSADLSVTARADAFKQLMATDQDLKHACDRQLALFNELGLTCRRKLFRENPLVSLLTHASIYLWVILHPYIRKRRRDAGEWFAKPYLAFTLRCVEYTIKHGHGLHLGHANGDEGLRIHLNDVKSIKAELRKELKVKFRE